MNIIGSEDSRVNNRQSLPFLKPLNQSHAQRRLVQKRLLADSLLSLNPADTTHSHVGVAADPQQGQNHRFAGSNVPDIDHIMKNHMKTLDTLQPGDPLYRLLIKEYYANKQKGIPEQTIKGIKTSKSLKRDIIRMHQFFKDMANTEGLIDINSFNKAFESKGYMQRITTSLFSYLDRKNKGTVSFEDFLLRCSPGMARPHAKIYAQWVSLCL